MRHLVILPLVLLAACSDDAPTVDKRAGEAKQLQGGEYAVTAKVLTLVSTDKSTPKTPLKVGTTTETKGCVAADGALDPKLFVDDAQDDCKVNSAYASNASLSLQMTCVRNKPSGYVTSAVSGSFTADSFKTRVTTGTQLRQDGDYQLIREVTGKRIGNCPAAPAKG